MNRKIATAVIITLFSTAMTWAGDADGKVVELSSPQLLSTGAEQGSLSAPHALAVNPAAAALVQRTTLDASYIGVVDGSDSYFNPKGHALNFTAMFPTKVGVFSSAGHFLTASGLETFNPGTQITAYGSFSKDVYPDLYFGSGARLTFGSEGGIAAAADLGIIRGEGDYLFLEDTYWGVSLLDLGYSEIEGDRRAPFTLSGGIDGIFAQNDTIEARLKADVSFPTFKNMRLGLGMGLNIADSLDIGIGSRMDFRNMFDGTFGELIPSVGISYTIRAGGGQDAEEDASPFSKNELEPSIFGAPMGNSLWAAGLGFTMPIGILDKTPPEIELDLSSYLDEENGDEENGDEENGGESEGEDTDIEAGLDKEKRESLASIKSKPLKEKKVLNTVQDTGEAEKESEKEEKESEKEDGEEYQDTLPPDAQIYISPNNDGVQDVLEFPIDISERRYIQEFAFVVTDEEGNRVRTIRNKESRPEIRTVGGFFRNLFASKEGVEIPDTIRWNGNTDEGETAPDGLYNFYIEAVDDNGNAATSDSYTVYVDTTPPKVDIEEKPREERLFSPHEHSLKNTLPIDQKGSKERLWEGRIEDSSGKTVRTYRWENARPESFNWDGTNDDGILVPDGVYVYKIEARDRAGNRGSAEYGNIIKNTEETPVSLKIDRSHFSPNGDERKDTVTITPEVPEGTGIVSWDIDIIDSEGEVHRNFSGSESPPGTTVFDGKGEDGKVLPEDEYRARVEVLYRNGNNPSAESPRFNLDVTPPEVSINADTSIFSPTGDGTRDNITFNQETSVEDVWYGTISREDEEGNITKVRTYKWMEKAPSSLSWDGRTDDGSLAEDSDSYYYQVYAEDKAGNRGESRRLRFELTTKETPVFLSVDKNAFSPNNSGVKDELYIEPKLEVTEGVENYTLSIYEDDDSDSEPVRTFEGSRSVPDRITWNGRNEDGDVVPDGEYRAEIEVEYRHTIEEASYGTFTVDTEPPSITIEAEYSLFSPDGDGHKDSVVIRQSGSEEDLWQGEILDEAGDTVTTAFWKGRPGDFTWDGTDNAGNTAPDGEYVYRVSAQDEAGNKTEEESEAITVDTRPTNIFVTADSDKLAPTGDGNFEEISFSTIVNLRDGVESWYLELVNRAGAVQKRFEGEKRIPEKIVWDGKNEDGDYVEGRYTARFGVEYRKGNRPTAESIPFVLDISPPEADIDISPKPFSPDDDGVDDELRIDLDVEDENPIREWSFTIYDPENREFKTFEGSGSPAEEIIWDGKSDDGELVYSAMDYPYEFEVTDELLNTRTIRGDIPVDVLVVREDGVLKIKIANINFKPNSAEFVDDDPEIAARNTYVLDRIAEILKKYRRYEITIEGHAVITRWYDEELAEEEQEEELIPLSKERAERVKEALTDRDVSANRLATDGVGGNDPLVPHSDEDNRWKNRRVEFILERE
ncbi:MAG: FlgD immunoglobulin-like domain containing protein [Spirochaetia bacterium]